VLSDKWPSALRGRVTRLGIHAGDHSDHRQYNIIITLPRNQTEQLITGIYSLRQNRGPPVETRAGADSRTSGWHVCLSGSTAQDPTKAAEAGQGNRGQPGGETSSSGGASSGRLSRGPTVGEKPVECHCPRAISRGNTWPRDCPGASPTRS
jgi:hypothetical protein